MTKQFPDMNELSNVAWAFAQRRIDRLSDEKKFSEALAAVAPLEPLIGKEKLPELGGFAYHCWGRHLAREKQWSAAIDRYREGIQTYPQDKKLPAYAAGAIHEWARAVMSVKNWDEGIGIYRQVWSWRPAIVP